MAKLDHLPDEASSEALFGSLKRYPIWCLFVEYYSTLGQIRRLSPAILRTCLGFTRAQIERLDDLIGLAPDAAEKLPTADLWEIEQHIRYGCAGH